MADIDLFLYHQANIRILETVRDLLAIPADKVYVNIDRYGNTSAASVPMALAEAVATGRVHVGDRLLMGRSGRATPRAPRSSSDGRSNVRVPRPGEQTRAGQPQREPVVAGGA